MPTPVSLDEARLFLRVTHTDEDGLISTLIDAAQARIEAATGLSLTDASPAPLRLAILYLLAQAYDGRGDGDSDAFEAWIAPYREVRL